MYQYIWFQQEKNVESLELPKEKPLDWIEADKIKKIWLSVWREHCLECAVPLCYHNCENWVERIDKKCQKSFYGTKRVVENCCLPAAQIRLRKWGKIEAVYHKKAVSVKKYLRIEKLNNASERFVLFLSNLFKKILPTYKLCGAQVAFREKVFNVIGRDRDPKKFLIQCYSKQEKSYKLMIEIFSPKGVLFRNSMTVNDGYNQKIFDVSDLNFRTNESLRVRIYTEQDRQEEIVFICSDFVELKNEGEKAEKDSLPAAKVKCVAWDLDKTIWDDILIESDPMNLNLRPNIAEIIDELDKRGIIQVVISKNDEEQVIPVLKRLGIDNYFVYIIANWNSKSSNLMNAAKLLNININTFALIDDSEYERQEVKHNLPNVRTYNEKIDQQLLDLPEFTVPITDESKKRRIMYQTEAERKRIQTKFNGSDLDFLKDCKLKMEISNPSEETFERAFELLQRTNQLNLSGNKYSREELKKLIGNNNNDSFVVKCRDRFGDYGQVGFFMLRKENDISIIFEYAVSCRVAGKWIEPALIQWIAQKYNAETVVFCGVNNKKNELLIRTLKDFGLIDLSEGDGDLRLEIKSSQMNWDKVVSVNEKNT